MGQVISRSLPTADYPASEPYRLDNMVATLLHTMFDIGQLCVDTGLPRELSQLVQRGERIGELF